MKVKNINKHHSSLKMQCVERLTPHIQTVNENTNLNMRKNSIEIACNICESIDYELISRRGQFGLPVNVVICKNCGLTYLNPRWSKERYQLFYKQEYDRYYRPNFRKIKPIISNKKNIIYDRLNFYDKLPVAPSNILDIGTGDGINLEYFMDVYSNANFYAIEPSSQGQRLLDKKGIVLLADDVDTDWEQNNNLKFDLIIMRHVLEHFLDPLAVLKKIQNCLSDDGILYLAVPNALTPFKPLQGFWFRVVHTYYFNKYSLRNLMALSRMNSIVMKEGDDYNPTEIFLIAKLAKNELKPEWNNDIYRLQRDFFVEQMKNENYPIIYLKSMINLYLPWLVKLKKQILG
ncbi:MAG: class I SAM-dependent methyltransferase [Bacteroidales bacterium]|nr:class I SAM-dependent methyltransferase [Bacteroidales bacterium]